MRALRSVLLLVLLTAALLSSLGALAQGSLRFIENRGQWPDVVTFRGEVPGATLWFERGALLMDHHDADAVARCHGAHAGKDALHASPVIRHHVLRMRFPNATAEAAVHGEELQPGHHNYFLGNDPARWASGAAAYAVVQLEEVAPGCHARFSGTVEGAKFDLMVQPGADPQALQWTYDGADRIELKDDALLIHTSIGIITERIPLAYQDIDGVRIPVHCSYTLHDGMAGVELGQHDPGHLLVIDPTLRFSTFSGSFSDNFGYTATFDQAGFLYSGSTAFGSLYPTTTGAYQTTWAGGNGQGAIPGTDVALTKYDTTGTFIVWSTLLGGSGDEMPHSLIVNNADELFVLGTTGSPNFPITAGAYDASFGGGSAIAPQGLGVSFPLGSDMFIARISNDGTQLLASTYLGGSANDGLNTAPALKFNYADEVRGEILLDANNNVLIVSCTQSTDYPVTANALQPTFAGGSHDGVITKLDASLTTLIQSTFLGGSGADALYSTSLADDGSIHVSGGTTSQNIPTTPGSVFPNYIGGPADGYTARISASGNALIAGTYWGSSGYDQAYFVELDQFGQVYLFGQTNAPAGQLVFNAPYNVPAGGQFISKFSPQLDVLELSSRFGNGDGTPDISPTAFLVDYCNKIYISGWGSGGGGLGGSLSTTGLPVTSDGYQTTTTGNDFYLAVFEIDMSSLFYATYFGGSTSAEHVDGGTSRFDRRGRVYQSVCAGCGGNSDFPIVPDPGAVSATNNSSNCNNGVFKFDFNFPIVLAGFLAPPGNCLSEPTPFTNTSEGATSYQWSFGDGANSTDVSPTHSYPAPGVYTVTLIASDPAACNLADTVSQSVVVLGNTSYDLADTTICAGDLVQIGIPPLPDPALTYAWNPPNGLSSTSVPDPFAGPSTTTAYTLLVSNGICTDTLTQNVVVQTAQLNAGPDTIVCGPSPVLTLTADGQGSTPLFQWSSNSNFSDTLNTALTDSTVSVTPGSVQTWYHVQALGNACLAQDSVLVTVELLDPAVLGDSLICTEDSASLELFGVEQGSSITWVPEEDITEGQGTPNAVVFPDATTGYGVNVVSPAGCAWSGTITVQVSPITGPSVAATVDQNMVLPGTTVQLNAIPDEGVTYTWTPANVVSDPTAPNPTATVQQTTTFTVTVSDGICTRSASVTVSVFDLVCEEPDIFVPNSFTPNGDGTNDILFVRGQHITDVEFLVFDRWGEKVFETFDQNVGWDGSFKGQEVGPAVFVYHLTAWCADGQRYFTKGNVTVIR